jgi:hypothetical protein
MSDLAAIAEAHEQALGLLADRTLKLALHLQESAMEIEDPDQKVRLALAFHRVGRGLRQTLALHKRFVGERVAGDAKAEREAEEAREAPRDWKCARVRHAMERLVWTEHERDEDYEDGPGERLLEDIEARIEALSDEPEFLATEDAALIARLCEEFGFEVPAHIVKALAIVAEADAPRPSGRAAPNSS